MATKQRHFLVSRSIAAGVLMLIAGSAYAQSGVLDFARDKWSEYQSGRTPKSEPVAAQGAVETWGDPAPRRDTNVEARSAERVANRAGIPQGRAPAPQRNQDLDERNRDDRFGESRPRAPVRAAAQNADEYVPAAPVRTAAPKRSIEERAYERAGGGAQHESPGQASCVNVRRAWEGAAALAERGQEARAYDAYLRLLSSCNDEKELLGTVYQAQKNLSAESISQLLQEPVMASPKLTSVVNVLKLQQMYAANRAKDVPRALALSREIRSWVLSEGNAGALEVSGWLEHRSKNSKVAETLFRAALKADRDSESARQGLVFALLAQDKVEAANREAQRLESADAGEIRAEVLVAQARENLKAKRYAKALEQLDEAERGGAQIDDSVIEARAWALKGSGANKQAADMFLALAQAKPGDRALAGAAVESLMQSRQYDTVKVLAEKSDTVGVAAREATAQYMASMGQRKEAAKMMGQTAEGYAGGMSGGVVVRGKSGDVGEGKLRQTTVPVAQLTYPVGESTEVKLSAERINVDDGRNHATGTELRAGVKTKVEGVDVEVLTGMSRVGGSTKPVLDASASMVTAYGRTGLRVSHLPVIDSVRSYAGAGVDVPVGPDYTSTERRVVGRVMDTQASLYGSTPMDDAGAYVLDWNVAAGSMKGTNSYNNGYYKAGFALMHELSHPNFSWLNVGPYLKVSSFERDENRFDGAYGGYFSPKSDVGIGLAGNLLTKEGNRSLHKASGQVGYVSRGLYYGNDSGLSLETSTQSAWIITPHLIVGAGVSFRASPGYTDFALKVGLTIPFEARTQLFGSDLTLFKAQ